MRNWLHENRGGVDVIVFADGSVGPATEREVELLAELKRKDAVIDAARKTTGEMTPYELYDANEELREAIKRHDEEG